ncbi:MAG: ABC transporter ATP-binding protein [Spirochaetia bacterium]
MEKKALIQIRGLTKRFDQTTVLDNIDLDIYEGDITIILGESGCGKSTLLKNIIRLVPPTEGEVKLFGNDMYNISEKDVEAILSQIGVLFQSDALLNSISLFDNIAVPIEQHTNIRPELIEKMVRVKLNLVGLVDSMYKMPSELSGGMKKRASLTRSIAMDPQVLFCDEPGAGLDPLTSLNLDKLLLKLKKELGMTMVIVTHELLSVRRICDRIVFLDKGKIAFTGTLEEAEDSEHPAVRRFFDAGSARHIKI